MNIESGWNPVSRCLTILAVCTLPITLTACHPATEGAADGVAPPSSSRPAPIEPAEESAPAPIGEPAAEVPAEAMFAERDRFLIDQQQPPGTTTLVARTPAQQDLIAQQRAWIESQGGAWTSLDESITLALALDACETSILNGHTVDVETFRFHVATSPLIEAIAGDQQAARDNAVSVMVFGAGFLCPADAPQWEAAWAAAG